MSRREAKDVIFISFFGGDKYYHDAAKNLKKDCDRLKIDHDVEEIQIPPAADWATICRQKIAFYARKLNEHKRPVFWLDVDTRILSRPTALLNARFDFAAFLRNFKYLRDYDPAVFSRTFHPGFLFFNYTDAARSFLDKAVEIEHQAAQVKATDDFFLQEAWSKHSTQMQILLLPPSLIQVGKEKVPNAWFHFGASGNVDNFIKEVEQHSAPILDPRRQVRVLKALSEDEVRKGNFGNASVYLKKIISLDKLNDDAVPTLSRVARRLGGVDDAMDVYSSRLREIKGLTGHGSRYANLAAKAIDAALGEKNYAQAKIFCDQLTTSKDVNLRNLGASRAFKIDLDVRAAAASIPDIERTNVWWMEQPYPGNFGDILNPYIIEKVTQKPPKWIKAGDGMLAIGSVIKFAKAGTAVWGTGTPRLTDKLNPDAAYHAVRGPLTRRLVLDSGGKCEPVYGDPALLLPRFYFPKVDITHSVGLIRHFTHKDSAIQLGSDVKEIDIYRCGYDQIEEFIREILACETIVSSSLHGLIVAVAYGKKAVWATVSESEKIIPGGFMKFFDFWSSVGVRDIEPLDLSQVAVLDSRSVRKSVEIEIKPRMLDDLLASFPRPKH